MDMSSCTASLFTISGHLSSEMFVQLLEGKASFLKGCGITVTMPSAETLSQASPDIIDRIQAIKEVNLSGMNNLAGELRGFRPSPLMGTLPGTFFITPHPSCTYPTTPGNIEVFKGMQIKELNLRSCKQLTGT